MADSVDQATGYPQLNDAAKAFVAELLSTPNLIKAGKSIQAGLEDLAQVLAAFLATLLTNVAGPIAVGIIKGQHTDEADMQEVAATALSGMFGENISAGALSSTGSDAGVKTRLAEVVTNALGNAGSNIQPGDAGAKKFIATSLGFAIDGWIQAFIFETLGEVESLGYIKPEQFGQLKDVLIETLGLGRLMRTVLHPLINTTVVTPYQWLMNKTYYPQLLSSTYIPPLFYRGVWTKEQALEEFARQGYSPDRAMGLMEYYRKRLTVSDAVFLREEGGYTADWLTGYLKNLGYDDETAQLEVAVAEAKRHRQWMAQLAAVAMEGYVRGNLDDPDFQSVLSEVYTDPTERGLVAELADLKRRAARPRLTHSEIVDAVKRNILSITDYRHWLDDRGYSTEDADALELLLQSTIHDAEDAATAKAKIAQEKAQAKATADAAKAARAAQLARVAATPNLAALKAAVVEGIVSIDRYRAAIETDHPTWSAEDVTALVDVAQQARDAYVKSQQARALAAIKAGQKNLSLADLEQAVEHGYMTLDDFTNRLTAAGFSGADAQLLAGLVNDKMAAAAAAAAARAAAAAKAAQKGINLGEAETAVLDGVWTLGDYTTWLESHGYDAVDAATLTAELAARLAAQQAAQAKRDAAAAAAATRNISLASLEQAVIHGLRPIDDYRKLLASLRYSLADQDTLVSLLQEKVDAYTAAQAKHAQIATATASKPLSLAQVERAVKIGILSLTQYHDYLAAAGYDDADIATLQGLLAADLAAAAAAKNTHAGVAAQLATRGIDLAAIEARVVAGLITIAQYQSDLVADGVDETTAAALAGVLADKIAERQDATALDTTVSTALAAKNLSLAQWKQAVKSGLKSLADYYGFLVAQGYTTADAQVLTTLLSQQLPPPAPAPAS